LWRLAYLINPKVLGLITEYPSGFIFACLFLGGVYSFILYYRDLKSGPQTAVLWSMVVLRFLSVSIISFLVLSPLIRQSEKLIQKPIVVIGVDNSRSVILAGDSAYYKSTFPSEINKLAHQLGKKCEVRIYSLGEHLKNGFDASYADVYTDISAFFNEVTTRYSNRNAAAVILASDGIYNKGTDPFYAAQKIPFPVYTIALGDTNLKKDINIHQILVNKTVFKGDKFPVEITVEMNKCNGLNSRLTLSRGNRIMESRDVKATSNRFLQKVTFLIDAGETGMIKYSLRLSDLEGEADGQNNRMDFFVDVTDTRQKVAVIFDAPHPDIGAILKAVEGSLHFETDLIRSDSLPKNFDKYDLAILNQLPSVVNMVDLTSLLKSRTSLLFIIGSQTDLNAFNHLKIGLVINSAKSIISESQPVLNKSFSLFELPKADDEIFAGSPPLQSPFGQYQYSPLTDILFYQKIGTIESQLPLVMFTRLSEKKIGIIAGENIWRWRVDDYIRASSHEAFDLLIDKMVKYLSTKDDKSFFRIHMKSKISENDPVEMDAELFNATYELINGPEVNMTITDESGKAYPFLFNKTLKSYYLNAGLFPVGEYSYKATTTVGPKLYQKKGKFYVERINIESVNLVADQHELFRIATAHDGEMIGRDSISILADKIIARQDIRSVSINQNRMTDLIGNPWLFAVILALLTAEWIVRKREGK